MLLMQTWDIEIHSERDMATLAAELAPYSVAGDIFFLEGTLGAGKTTFARAFIRASGSANAHVPSPTFTLVQTYDDTRIPIAHVDCYRMESDAELEGLNLMPFFKDGISLVEWPEKVKARILAPRSGQPPMMELDTPDTMHVTLTIDAQNPDIRHVQLAAEGSWVRRLNVLPRFRATLNRISREEFLAQQQLRGHVPTSLFQDMSFRTYWRLNTAEGSRVLMDAPPPMENIRTFLQLAAYYRERGVPVPKIYAQDIPNGYALIEDFGDVILHDALKRGENAQPLFEEAVNLLLHFQQMDAPAGLPRYSSETVWAEVCRYTDWYLPYVNEHATFTAARREWRTVWQDVFPVIANVPFATVHWDYHVGNLMIKPDRSLGLIDFQDSKLGPVTFDLACLLEDRYPVSEELKTALKQRVAAAHGVSYEAFDASYTLCALHRALKVTGLLVRLKVRDKREGALARMESTWQTIDRLCQHPAAAPIRDYLDRTCPTHAFHEPHAVNA